MNKVYITDGFTIGSTSVKVYCTNVNGTIVELTVDQKDTSVTYTSTLTDASTTFTLSDALIEGAILRARVQGGVYLTGTISVVSDTFKFPIFVGREYNQLSDVSFEKEVLSQNTNITYSPEIVQ